MHRHGRHTAQGGSSNAAQSPADPHPLTCAAVAKHTRPHAQAPDDNGACLVLKAAYRIKRHAAAFAVGCAPRRVGPAGRPVAAAVRVLAWQGLQRQGLQRVWRQLLLTATFLLLLLLHLLLPFQAPRGPLPRLLPSGRRPCCCLRCCCCCCCCCCTRCRGIAVWHAAAAYGEGLAAAVRDAAC